MKRGPSGKVVCRVCRKWLPRKQAVEVNEQPMHVKGCFAVIDLPPPPSPSAEPIVDDQGSVLGWVE